MIATIEVSDPDALVDPVQIICTSNLQVFVDPERNSSSLTPEATTTGASTNPAMLIDQQKWIWNLTDGYIGQTDITNLIQLIFNRQSALIKESPPRFLNFRDGVQLRAVNGSDYSTTVRITADADFLNSQLLVYQGENKYRVSFVAREV